MKRIAVACAGEPETEIESALARGDVEVVVVMLDFGEDQALEALRDRALAAGAVRAHVLDVRDEFAHDYLLPALKAGALVPAQHPTTRALRRAIVSRKIHEIAALERAVAIEPAEWPAGAGHPLRRGAAQAAAQVEVTFDRGTPVALNGVTMALVDLFESLGTIAGAHGIGPDAAAAVLQRAHDYLQAAVVGADLTGLSRGLSVRYADLTVRGEWFTTAREALDAFFAVVQQRVSGTVGLTLSNGSCEAHDYAVVGSV